MRVIEASKQKLDDLSKIVFDGKSVEWMEY
ncbi:hypothetical protein DE170_003482 [Clostridium acetobutylicum]|nr:hypothetical protein [Clostridium acetobutylicum]NOW15201.1 hypothetical protein [Clostridium acetobutylicum]